jgi:hypothetical protein
MKLMVVMRMREYVGRISSCLYTISTKGKHRDLRLLGNGINGVNRRGGYGAVETRPG